MPFRYPVITETRPRRRAAALRGACRGGAPFVLLAPPSLVFSDQALTALAAAADSCPPRVAALAARVLPDGPDWHCDPVTLEADALRLQGVLLRCAAVAAVGGLDARLSGAAADADLCWRLRGAGWSLLYCPQVPVWDRAAVPGAETPQTKADAVGPQAEDAGLAADAAPTLQIPAPAAARIVAAKAAQTAAQAALQAAPKTPAPAAGKDGETADADGGLRAYLRDTVSACVLRAKYGRPGLGLQTALNTLRRPQHYDGVRKALLAAAPGCLGRTLAAGLRPAPAAARRLADLDDGFGPRRGRCPLSPAARRALWAAQPMASVIVRTCGRPDTLRQTLACLRHQTYPYFEVVVVEDGPPTAQDMLQTEFADLPLHYHATGQQVGRGRAANLGMQLAKGAYIGILDDDDFYYPDYLELHLAALLQGDRGFVLSSIMAQAVQVQSRTPYVYEVKQRYPVIFDHITLMDMCVRCRVPSSGGMVRRALALAVGGMREDIDGDEDWALWLRCWQRQPRRQSPPEIPRAVSIFGYPADPAQAAARLAAYQVYDEQLLADESLRFACDAAEVALWRQTVEADLAHLAALGQLQPLQADAARHDAAPLGADSGSFTAAQINRYYWYLVQRYGA